MIREHGRAVARVRRGHPRGAPSSGRPSGSARRGSRSQAYAEYLGSEKARLEAAVAVAAGKLRHRVAEITRGREGA